MLNPRFAHRGRVSLGTLSNASATLWRVQGSSDRPPPGRAAVASGRHACRVRRRFCSGLGRLPGRCLPLLVRALRVLQLLGDLVGVGELSVGRQSLQVLQDAFRGTAAPGGSEQILCTGWVIGPFDVLAHVLGLGCHGSSM